MLRFSLQLFILLYIGFLSLCAVTNINNLVISGDGYENLSGSYYLASEGTISNGIRNDAGKLISSNQREPFPILLGAAWIKLNPALNEIESVSGFQKAQILELLKFQNVFYLFLMLLGVYLLSKQLIESQLSTFNTIIFSLAVTTFSYLCLHKYYLNTLLTEIHAAALLVWFLWIWLLAKSTRNRGYSILAGAVLGLLVLSKGAFVYIGAVSMSAYLFWLIIIRASRKEIFNHFALILSLLVVVFPWYLRNYNAFGICELTQRGPVVLLTRAYQNAIVHHESWGAIYAFSPLSMKNILSQLTGYTEQDRVTGGRLQRLTRFPVGDLQKRAAGDEEAAISYYIKATTHHANIHKQYQSVIKDTNLARTSADKQSKKEAFAIIRGDWAAHLQAGAIFAWRGAWPANTIDGRWSKGAINFFDRPVWAEWFTFAGLISMITLFIAGLTKKCASLVELTSVGVGAFCFYSLLTHFIPRYSEMFIPLWVLCFSYSVMLLIKFCMRKANFKLISS